MFMVAYWSDIYEAHLPSQAQNQAHRSDRYTSAASWNCAAADDTTANLLDIFNTKRNRSLAIYVDWLQCGERYSPYLRPKAQVNADYCRPDPMAGCSNANDDRRLSFLAGEGLLL